MCCAQTAARKSSYALCGCQANEASTGSQVTYCSVLTPSLSKDGAAGSFPGMQELARIALRTCLESLWTSEYLPETSYRCPEAFSASLRSILGMPRELPTRSQDAPEIQKMISESLRARPQDPSGTVFNDFCK